MERQSRVGGAIYGAAIVSLGLVSLVLRNAVPDLEPLPASLPARVLIAMLVALILVAAGASLTADWRARTAARTVGAVLTVWLVALQLPRVIAQPKNGGAWVVLWEVAAMAAAIWMFALSSSESDSSRRPPAYVAVGLRIVFGLSFIAFGISHFVYHGYVESVIPAWIPGHSFFATATGIAHIAAGVSLLTRVQEQLATALLSVMFGTWVLVLHIPRVIAHPRTGNEWTSMLIAAAMCGGSLIVRAFLATSAARAPAVQREVGTSPGLMAVPRRKRA